MEQQKKKHRVGAVRPAFTLVELLVVIAIIGMLMALLMPAISVAREHGRRIKCLNNQMQIGKALLAYESSHGSFPGWRNYASGASGNVAWPAMLLPNLDRSDLWQKIKTGGSPSGTYLALWVCPTDPPVNTVTYPGTSAYVANGLVLRDNITGLTTPPQTLDYVSSNDGTSTTLMLSENTQAPPTAAFNNGAMAKAHNWYDTNPLIVQTFGYAPLSSTYYPAAMVTFASAYGSQITYYNNNPMTANINSSHSGGVNVIFFDSHGQFLRDDAGLNLASGQASGGTITVYQILVTPEGSKNLSEPPASESDW